MFFFQKNDLCHSFCFIVIPSILLSFLPNYCHSFRIIVIPSKLVSFLRNIVIPSELFRELQILISSKNFPYPKDEKNGHRRWPYKQVKFNIPKYVSMCLDVLNFSKISSSLSKDFGPIVELFLQCLW